MASAQWHTFDNSGSKTLTVPARRGLDNEPWKCVIHRWYGRTLLTVTCNDSLPDELTVLK